MKKSIKETTDHNISFTRTAWRRFKTEKLAMTGLIGIIMLALLALLTPLLANNRPLLIISDHGVSMPFLRYIFAPDSTESFIEQVFNYSLLYLPLMAIICLAVRSRTGLRALLLGLTAALLLLPFLLTGYRLDKTNWRERVKLQNSRALFAPVPFGPYEQTAEPYLKPDGTHLLGTDQIGRDILSRMLYGTRVSLAVGLFATVLSLIIGTIIGMCAGYFRGRFDLISMRIVEVILCFPTFLLLLILMAIFKEAEFNQSILLVILVLGLTGWIGLCRLVRGETLKQRILPYIASCEATGLPVSKIMLFHLLPNITGPILISFTFGVAGAILAESSLSFLGFGVQAPTASWGELLRQAFANPFEYWHLTLWPGLALFFSVCAFNFTGEGLRKVFDPKA
ncbi:ABC transporter permease [Lentisphaerota bacterium ZTH]|nr:ABC transporter permease [Lentisphaerota bacterium]WET05657.1 ABC transporter permease [Lentisphaerota bacterium ZTH]